MAANIAAFEMRENRIEYRVDGTEDVCIRKPNDAKAIGFERRGPPHIVRTLFREPVLIAVDFDDEPGAVTTKVDDELADRSLSAKMVSWQTAPQSAPQSRLGFGQCTP